MKEYISKKYEIVARLQLRGKHFEFWLPIKDFPNYEVSTEGRIKNMRTGKIKNIEKNVRNNYKSVKLCKDNKAGIHVNVPRVVLETFTKTPCLFGRIIHLDGNPANNSLSNIEYQDGNLFSSFDEFARIDGYPNYLVNKRGLVVDVKKGILLSRTLSQGYFRYNLQQNGIKRSFKASRLVAAAFIPNPNNLPFVNHINGKKNDDRVENLEWVTAKENSEHAVRTNLIKSGEECSNAILKSKYIPWIRKMHEVGISYAQIARLYGVTPSTIRAVIISKNWKQC